MARRAVNEGLYPAVLDLSGAGVLVLGGGTVALRKLKGLPRAVGPLRVVSPDFSPALRAWARGRARAGARSGRVELKARTLRPGDLDGRRLLLCCASSPAANAAAAALARGRGLWVCQAQEPSQGDVLTPAAVRAGGLLLALSTGGASPALAKALAARLGADLERSDLAWFLARLARLRPRLKSDPLAKARLLRRAASPAAVSLVLAPRSRARRRRLEALLKP